jgi:hypothetical protein
VSDTGAKPVPVVHAHAKPSHHAAPTRRQAVAPPPPKPGPVAARASSPAQPQPLLPPPHAPKLPPAAYGASAGTHGGTSTGLFFLLTLTAALLAPGVSRRLRRLVDRPVPSAFVALLERPG